MNTFLLINFILTDVTACSTPYLITSYLANRSNIDFQPITLFMKQLTKESMVYMHTLSFENIYILLIKGCRGNFLVKSI